MTTQTHLRVHSPDQNVIESRGGLQEGTRLVDGPRKKIEFRARSVAPVVARCEVALHVTKDVAKVLSVGVRKALSGSLDAMAPLLLA